jgi:hypothetical protein
MTGSPPSHPVPPSERWQRSDRVTAARALGDGPGGLSHPMPSPMSVQLVQIEVILGRIQRGPVGTSEDGDRS